jgi:hypothetical protein
MWRDIVVFAAGAEAFHTLVHFFLPYYVKFPIETPFLSLTSSMNVWALIINGAITVALLWLAAWMKRRNK